MKNLFKSIMLIMIILFCAVPGSNAIAAETEKLDPLLLEAYLDGVIKTQMDEQHIPGVTLSVVQGEDIILLKGYGYADLEKQIPVDPRQTLFRIGSTAKLITWTAVMQLVEAGNLDLNADVNSYLDFEIPTGLINSPRGTRAEPLTLAHLLTHTPGFEDQGEGLFVLEPDQVVTLEEYLKQNIPARIYEPGTIMAYSNYGAALAGYIVQRVSGLPFAEYVEINIFAPLDMRNSTVIQPPPAALIANMAEGYGYQNGRYYKSSFEYISALPAGSMSSTAEDMAKFMIAHLQDGRYGDNLILQKQTAETMHSRLFTHHPAQLGMAHGFIEETFNGYRAIGHSGNTLLFNTGLYLFPELELGIFVSYNGGLGTEWASLIQLFMDRYYPEKQPPEPKPLENRREALMQLIGEYLPARANYSTMEKMLSLFQPARVKLNDERYLIVNMFGKTMQFAEIEPGVFHNRDTAGTRFSKVIVFVELEDGRILMSPAGPMPYIKAPWYGTVTATAVFLGIVLALILSATIGWLIASIGRLLRREGFKAPILSLLARLVAAGCGLLSLNFIIGLLGVMGDINPAFGVPQIFFGATESFDSLMNLPLLIAITAGLMIIFTTLSWYKKYWNVGGRLHYSLITAGSLIIVWLLFYYNLL